MIMAICVIMFGGGDSSFYFDNEGAYACIWKTDIKNKTTQRILPIEEMSKPYYLKYNDEDIVIASYSYYQKKEENNTTKFTWLKNSM